MAGVSDVGHVVVVQQLLDSARQTQLQFVHVELGHASLQAVLARLADQRLHLAPLLYTLTTVNYTRTNRNY